MTSDLPWRRGGILISTVAAAAVAEVQDSAMDHATHMGRSGIMVRLRMQARELAQSAIGRDQVRSRAFEAAADDIAWGRAPLADWRTFAIDAAQVSDADRAALRAGVPEPDETANARGRQVAREIERRALSTHDACDAIRGLAAELGAEAEIQESLWDDPRIAAAPELRALMRASVFPLRRRVGELALPAHPAPPPQAAPAVRGWRRLFATR